MYKNKYCIGIYANDEYETLMALCDSLYNFAETLKIKIKDAWEILKRLFNGENNNIRFAGRLCKVEFIDMDEEFNDAFSTEVRV